MHSDVSLPSPMASLFSHLRRAAGFVLVVGCAGMGVAQSSSGGLFCTVLDHTSGKPIRGARIVLTSPTMPQARSYATDSKGEIHAVLLPAGVYRVTIAQTGYVGVLISDLRVASNVSRTFDMVRLPGFSPDKTPPENGSTARKPVEAAPFLQADGGAPEVRLGAIACSGGPVDLELLRADLRRKVEVLASAGLLKGAASELVLGLAISAAGNVLSVKLTGAPARTYEALCGRIGAWSFDPLEEGVVLRVPVLLGR